MCSTDERLERCDRCRYWVASTSECRRNAPILHPEVKVADASGRAVGVWPLTLADGWCGEWMGQEEGRGNSQDGTKGNDVAVHLFLARLAPGLSCETTERASLLTSLLGQLQPNVRRVVIRVNGLDGQPLGGLKAVARELRMSHSQVQALLKAGEERLEQALRLIARDESR